MSSASESPGVLAWWVVRRRRWVVAAWAAALVALAPHAARVERVLDVSARVDGSESWTVDEMLRERFDSPFAHYAVLVVTGADVDPATDGGVRLLSEIVAAVREVPGVTGTISNADHPDRAFIPARGGGTFVVVGIAPGDAPPDAMVPLLRRATERLAARLAASHPGLTLRWTGDVALNYDLRRVSAAEGQAAERRALPLTLVMLLVAFGALAAALLPLALGMLAITLALGAAAALASHWPLSILLENVVTMLGLGLGVDYALLMVSRFREELAAGHQAHEAAARAARGAGHTILLSGAAVLIGFAALVLIPLNELRAVAVGGALVVAAAALLTVTLLPALLATLGARVNLGRVRRRAVAGDASERWRRWGGWVSAHPTLVLLVAGAPVVALALQARRMETALPRTNWLPPAMESARALDDLARMGRAGVVHSLRVIVELPAGTSTLEPGGWEAVRRVGDALAADRRVERVQSLPIYLAENLGARQPSLLLLSMLPAHVVHSFVSTDQRAAAVEVLPAEGMDFPSVTRMARELRARDAAALTGVPGSRILVGGMPAFNADYEDAIAGRLDLAVGLVLAGTLLALLFGFRSVLIPLKAIALNLLSVLAALGAVVLVFQDGHGAHLFGVPGAMGSLFPALPALVFCIVFGLSMDYEVFLVARVAEARRAGMDERAAIGEGLARTGGPITGAAAIMIVVFGAFTLGDFLMIKVLGFALAIAVLLDATVVRMAIGPALLALAGRWNWWPGERRRVGNPNMAPPSTAPLAHRALVERAQ